jgi:transcriptional regulator with GAF, ATPase, and Fis domain
MAVPRTSRELKEQKKEMREKSVEEIERCFVLEALQRNDWNVSRAAVEVDMQRSNFQALMRRYRIAKPLNKGYST